MASVDGIEIERRAGLVARALDSLNTLEEQLASVTSNDCDACDWSPCAKHASVEVVATLAGAESSLRRGVLLAQTSVLKELDALYQLVAQVRIGVQEQRDEVQS